MNDEFPIPPPEELTDNPVQIKVAKARAAKAAAFKAALPKKPSVLIINDYDILSQ